MSRPEAAVESEGRQGDVPQAPPAASPQGPGPAEPRLDALVDQFVSEIERRFPRRLRTRPRTLKRRLLHLIRVKLPPRLRRPGRPRRPHITRALDLYRQQRDRRPVDLGSLSLLRLTLPWNASPGFAKIRSELKRRVELTRLRNAVYARESRKHRSAHKRRTRSSDGNNPPAC